jgi:hypothetical protein
MATQLALAVVCSIFIFPESVGSSFTRKLDGVLKPIESATDDLKKLFDGVKASKGHRLRFDRADSDPTVYGSETSSLQDEIKERTKLENLRSWPPWELGFERNSLIAVLDSSLSRGKSHI